MNEFWNAVILSAEIALCATAVALVVALPVAYFLARRQFFGKSVVEAALMVPLVLPPTVVGYLLILGLGRGGIVWTYLFGGANFSIVFTFVGAVLAAAVVAFPLLYLPAKAGFLGVDRDLEDVARVFGASWLQRFWHVNLPQARRSIASGLILAFARALGEFGATVMVYGHQPGKVTLPVSVYVSFESGELEAAWPAIVVLMVASLGLIATYNWTLGKRKD